MKDYPTDEELKFLREYDCYKNPVKPFIDTIIGLWAYSDWGCKLEKVTDEIGNVKMRLYLSTAGWSGNEDVMEALTENKYFFQLYWYSSRVGGHYIFEFPIVDYEEDEIKFKEATK